MAHTVRKNKPLVRTSRSSASKGKRNVSAPSKLEVVWREQEAKIKYASVVLAGGAALWVFYLVLSANGFLSFPLDDAWIHLTFARTLATTGRFAYGSMNAATSGSTSPLFTIVESLLFLVTRNEFAVSLIPSILAYLGSVFLFYLLVREYAVLPWTPLIGVVLFIAAPSLLVISNWGMETSLTITVLLWATLAYRREAWIQLAIALGLAIWARPDTVVLAVAIGLDYLYSRKHSQSKPGMKAMLLFIGVVVLYAGFNLLLSGTILPNTFYAKLAYYKNGNSDYWSELLSFLAGGGKIIIFILAIAGVGWMVTEKRRGNIALILYPLGMILLYKWKLPYLFQHGRYLIPLLPFVLLLAVIGSTRIASWLTSSTFAAVNVASILLIGGAIGELGRMGGAVDDLIHDDSYIHHLQVETARWCEKNLAPNDVIATHDIGALGYYSGKRIVDLVGLADPDMIPLLDKPAASSALRKKGVTYAALLDNWYEIPNENTVYVNAQPAGETMRVYHFTDSTRFTSSKVLPIHRYLYDILRGDDPSEFNEAMHTAIAYDPENALTYTIGGEVMLAMNKFDAAKKYFEQALLVFPSSSRALNGLSRCMPERR